MNAYSRFQCLAATLITLLLSLVCAADTTAGVIEGTIYDSATGEPVPRVTIRVENEGRAMLGNDDGRYRLRLDPGTYQLRFTHIAHYPQTIEITIGDSTLIRDVCLESSPILLPGTRVYERAYDPAQVIIVEAIRHKEELLAKIKDYRFEGYTKAIARKIKDGRPDEYFAIIETQLEGWYRKPDQYKEIITARRQSVNMPAEANIITIGEIFNFNANRIDLGSQAVISPTATDALDYYSYYLLDTVLVDGAPAFLLEVEPKTDAHPLFVGQMLIVDSSFAVAGVDFGLNEGFDAPYLDSLRFSQRHARFDNDIWMPIEIRFSGRLGIPVPGIPELSFMYTGVLNQLIINGGIPDDRFDEYVLEVAPEADDLDSTAWNEGALMPLTEEEQAGYRHIDSLKNRPLSIKKALGFGAMGLALATMTPFGYDYFHFNRVEGPYLGFQLAPDKLIPHAKLHLSTGYAFDGEHWQHGYGISSTLHNRSQLWMWLGYHDKIVARRTIFGGENSNSTVPALLFKYDPHDYYLEKGFNLRLGRRLIPHIHARIGYHDLVQYSVPNATDAGLFGDSIHRPNPPIADGHLRSVSAGLRYDSRPLMRSKGQEATLPAMPLTIISLFFEASDPGVIESRFQFRRYSLSLYRTQQLAGWGVTSLSVYLGGSDRALPPQRFFTVDAHNPYESSLQFKTLSETNFTGDRVASFYLSHDLGSTFFRRLHIPLLKELPFDLSVCAGTFWTDFRSTTPNPTSTLTHSAPDWYSEIGFGIGRLIPLLRFYFTWQLSAYDTNDFSFTFDFGL